jgi:hypothetical protein
LYPDVKLFDDKQTEFNKGSLMLDITAFNRLLVAPGLVPDDLKISVRNLVGVRNKMSHLHDEFRELSAVELDELLVIFSQEIKKLGVVPEAEIAKACGTVRYFSTEKRKRSATSTSSSTSSTSTSMSTSVG